jgi:predicted amidohydrolase YtcJ
MILGFGSAAYADTLLHNIQGYSSSDRGIQSFSVLIFDDNGRVLATGDDQLRADYPDATLLNGNAKTVLPGLTDAHGHVYGLGILKSNVDLAGSPSLAHAVSKIEAYASANANMKWITGRGWNQVLWPVKEFPSAKDIDAVVSDRPVWLRRIDGHAGWANSKTLQLAGITDDTADPVGGKILRDDNGHATGVLIDRAMDLVSAKIPEPDRPAVRDAIILAANALLAEGITSVHDAGINLMNAEVYLSLADSDQLDLRIYAMIGGACHDRTLQRRC